MRRADDSGSTKIFISWSGRESYALAEIIRDWLPTVVPGASPWMSSKDIAKGKRWDAELSGILERTSYCIVCVTPEVACQPWINFEAGAVSKIVREAHVSPLLWRVSVEDLSGLPLSVFQCTQFTKQDVCHLLESINSSTGLRIPTERLHKNLDYSWTKVSQRAKNITVSNSSSDDDSQGDGSKNGERSAAHQVHLDFVAEEILMVVAQKDDYPMDVEEVTREVHHTRVRTRHYLDRLVAAGYLSKVEEYESYEVTEIGRAYVVRRGLDLPF